MTLVLAKIPIFMHIIMVLWAFIALCLILVVLLQKGRGGGVGAAFGGAGASSLLGTKTGDFLTWVTIGMVALFLVMAVLMDKFLKPTTSIDTITPAGQNQQAEQSEKQAADQMPASGEVTDDVADLAEETGEMTQESADQMTDTTDKADKTEEIIPEKSDSQQ